MTARILHVLALDVCGGVESLFAQYLADPASREAEHHLLIMQSAPHPAFRPIVKARAASVQYAKYWHGLKVPSVGAWRRKHLRRAVKAPRPGLVVVYNSLGDMALAEAAQAASAPMLYYEQGGAWHDHPEADVRRFLDGTSAIVCSSRAGKRMLELRWKADPAKIRVRFNPTREEFLNDDVRRDGLRSPLRLGVIGRLISIKGVPIALHTTKELLRAGVECRLRIAGEGRDEGSLRKLAADLSLAGRAEFCGLVTQPVEFYREIDLLLCPSIRESFSIVAVEAASLGCPAVVSAIDGLVESVEHGKSGLCIPSRLPIEDYPKYGGSLEKMPDRVYDAQSDSLQPPRLLDPREMASAVRSIAASPETWTAMSRNGRERARRDLRPADYASWYTRALLDLAGSQGSGSQVQGSGFGK